jgi:hypothetical protein
MGYSTVRQDNLTANTKSANILAGDVNEFVSNGGQVTFYGVSSALGIKVTVYADGDIIIDDKEIIAINTTLLKSDHMFDSVTVEPGTRLAVYLRETAGVSTSDTLFGVETE